MKRIKELIPIRVLVIADDITGALDTGVQFSKGNVAVQVVANWQTEYDRLPDLEQTTVLVVNAQSRHLKPEEAAECIAQIVELTRPFQADLYYKKTDSVLRGNIGAELEALMRAVGEKKVCFAPAFPQNGRTTIGGVQYVGGLPIAETSFGKDLFDPVRHSLVAEIIAEQSRLDVVTVPADGGQMPFLKEETIAVFDAQTTADMMQAAERIHSCGAKVLAGCAGLAETLSDMYGLPRREAARPVLPERLIAVSGTMNPITIGQFRYAREAGMCSAEMRKEQICCPDYTDTAEGRAFVESLVKQAAQTAVMAIEAADSTLKDDEVDSSPAMRERVSENIGKLCGILMKHNPQTVFMLTGGDTLMSSMKQMGCSSVRPVDEILPGVVLSQMPSPDGSYWIVSKSGGFGPEDTLIRIEEYLKQHAV